MFDKELLTLKTIVQKTKHADIIVKDLANIERDKKTNDLVRRRYSINSTFGLKLSKEEVEEVYREFQRVGWGKLAIGRGPGVNSRFTWRIDYRELMQAFVGSAMDEAQMPPISKRRASGGQSAPRLALVDSALNETFVFKLRSSDKTLKLTRGEMLELDELIREIK